MTASPTPTGDWRVAYVLTHYPRTALTFLAEEIDAVERLGGTVRPIAINPVAAADLASPGAAERSRRTLYLKQAKGLIVRSTLAAFARHPIGMARLAWMAIRSAHADVALIGRRLAHLCYAAAVARTCVDEGIDHLHGQFGQAPATIAWFAAEIVNLGRGPRLGWSFTIHGFQDFVDEAVARLDLKGRLAAFVVCVSDFTRSQLCRITPPTVWDRFHVIRCGIDFDRFVERRQVPHDGPMRIVTVGRLSPEKGHFTLLRALRLARAAGADATVEMIGDGPSRDAIVAEAARLGVADHLVLSGEMPPAAVAERLAAADMFCMASFAEGLPISIMEAMAIGVPVVTTWISGIPELAVNGATALTVPPGNEQALADAILTLARDPALGATLAAAARRAVTERHSLKNVEQLVMLFTQAIATRRAAA